MDAELAKAVLPLLAGAMVLIGGLFTFINGRLTEAKTQDARERVIVWTLGGLSGIFSLIGMVAISLRMGLWFLIFFAVGFIIQIAQFARQTGPISRTELLMVSLYCSWFALFVSVVLMLDTIGKLVGLVGGIIEVLKVPTTP